MMDKSLHGLNRNHFGKDFVWGVASSALQTEGAHNLHGKGPSIWDEFADRGKIKGKHTHYQACNFYHQYRGDIALIEELKIPNFRFSLSWPRIIPNGTGHVNPKGIDYYHRLIDQCLNAGIEPWITLYHWDLPLMLERKGGWTNRDMVQWFSEYVQTVLHHFGSKVNNWMVLNEPLVFTGAGYFAGVHAPGKKGLKHFLPAVHHATLCMGAGLNMIKQMQPHAHVGTTFSCTHITPHSLRGADLMAAARMDALLNRLFIEPVLGLGYPWETLPVLKKLESYMKPGDEHNLKADFDFIGLQVYTREVVSSSFFTPYLKAKLIPAKERKVNHTRMNWEIYPAAIFEVVKRFSEYPELRKIIITENGASFHDELVNGRVIDSARVLYLQKHIQELLRAKQLSPKLAGYFVWSLTDNFEWAEGYDQRFGLIHVNYDTQERTIKDSGHWYSNFLKQSLSR